MSFSVILRDEYLSMVFYRSGVLSVLQNQFFVLGINDKIGLTLMLKVQTRKQLERDGNHYGRPRYHQKFVFLLGDLHMILYPLVKFVKKGPRVTSVDAKYVRPILTHGGMLFLIAQCQGVFGHW
jgi:hypothetical protein